MLSLRIFALLPFYCAITPTLAQSICLSFGCSSIANGVSSYNYGMTTNPSVSYSSSSNYAQPQYIASSSASASPMQFAQPFANYLGSSQQQLMQQSAQSPMQYSQSSSAQYPQSSAQYAPMSESQYSQPIVEYSQPSAELMQSPAYYPQPSMQISQPSVEYSQQYPQQSSAQSSMQYPQQSVEYAQQQQPLQYSQPIQDYSQSSAQSALSQFVQPSASALSPAISSSPSLSRCGISSCGGSVILKVIGCC